MPYLIILLIGLVLAYISPLLTFTSLFQLKEWRMDRLLEHLRREGYVRSLFGRIRPPLLMLLFLATCIYLSTPFYDKPDDSENFGMGILIMLVIVNVLLLFALLSIIQIVTRRQNMPKWTKKAALITILAILIEAGTLIITFYKNPVLTIFAPFIVILQPLFVLTAWAILKPLDFILKKRVMNRARTLRSSMKEVTVIGIAGSVGKTTTKELLAHVLQDLKPITTPAHVNTEMGVAQWLISQNSQTRKLANSQLFIIEMGAYAKGEIALLCSIAQPTIGVMTALGSDHLALFGSEEAIIETNGELIESLPKNGHAFFYGENDGCKKLAAQALCSVTLTGAGDLIPSNIAQTQDRLSFTIGNMPFAVPLHGHHNIHNTLLAIGTARHLGITDNRIKELLKTFRPPAHTFNVRTERGVLLLDDTYNISPLSLKAALDWAASQIQRPRTLLTSGLQETGRDENRFLQDLGSYARGKVDRVIFTHSHGTKTFAKAFQSPVEILGKETKHVESGTVLACVGRMPLSTVQRLLPQ